MPSTGTLALHFVFALAFGACAPSSAGETPTAEKRSASSEPSPSTATDVPNPEFKPAGPGDVAEIARRERKLAMAEGKTLLVYVGAPWCGPCTAFHDAADAGELDDELPPLRLLEFNLDVDKERLWAAGYQAPLIPIFAVVGEDGRPTGRSMHGGVKGSKAVDNLLRRLTALLAVDPANGRAKASTKANPSVANTPPVHQ